MTLFGALFLFSCEGRKPWAGSATFNRLGFLPSQENSRGRSAENGFTLIELMVVLVIIGLMSGAVMLTMVDPRGRVSSDIDRFAGRVHAARDSAIIAGRPVALWISPTGYGFERRARGQWQLVDDGPLAAQDWSGATRAQLGPSGQLRIMFDSVGRADQPLRFSLLRDGQQIALNMDLDGKVTSGE